MKENYSIEASFSQKIKGYVLLENFSNNWDTNSIFTTYVLLKQSYLARVNKRMTLKQKMDYFYKPYVTKSEVDEEILHEHSKRNWDQISNFILNKPIIFKKFFSPINLRFSKQQSCVPVSHQIFLI